MTSFSFRKMDRGYGVHVHVAVHAGPDAEHRSHAGTLTMKPDEWLDLQHGLRQIDFSEYTAGTIEKYEP